MMATFSEKSGEEDERYDIFRLDSAAESHQSFIRLFDDQTMRWRIGAKLEEQQFTKQTAILSKLVSGYDQFHYLLSR